MGPCERPLRVNGENHNQDLNNPNNKEKREVERQ